ncbi:hypothetical protein [Sellimonas intestinalis]|uniref:hypothetical protein n=1 Tax=Sellimonas intestinalis TaxID=1653434 RepID=UPI0022E0DEDF|nr:hypothetical protein [Sellimonas intestinalis]
MADQMINALPTKTEPVTGDKVLLSGASEEYLIDYDKLATAILNKLTSKTFTLDQGTKTFVAALNELNSKTTLSAYSVEKPSNIDGITLDVWTLIVRKFGRVVCLNFNISGEITKSRKFIDLFNLQDDYLPIAGIQHNYITQNGDPMLLNISGDGIVQLYSNSDKAVTGFFARQSLVFLSKVS